MFGIIGLGIGAGLVSALLFAVVATGSTPGMLLCYLAPLPILIAGLGWHHLVGLLGVFVGAFALSVGLTSTAGLAFVFSAGLPAWWLAYLALLRRPAPGPDGSPAWLGPGALLGWTAATAAFVAVASMVALGRGDFATADETLRRLATSLLRRQFGVPSGQPLPPVGGLPGSTLVDLLAGIAPAVAASVFTVVTAFNLWLAGRVVRMSGRLPRPWIDLPLTRMRGAMLAILFGAAVLDVLPGWPGVAGAALVGAVATAFSLQGLAFLHAATRGRAGRGGLLGTVYIALLFFGGLVLPLLTLVGLVDSATGIRGRLRPPPQA